MKVTYYLNEGRKKNLYCRISDGSERVSFSLAYTIDKKFWNSKDEESTYEDPYHYTLGDFKEYLTKRYHELKSEGKDNILDRLKIEAETYIDGSGIEGIARKMFDMENEADGIAKYDLFIEAFEKYSGLKKGEYSTKAVGSSMYFQTKDGESFEMDTYAGLRANLKFYVKNNSLIEIETMTDKAIWSEIYIDEPIEKHVFLPTMLSLWENHWKEEYNDIKKTVGKTDHLDHTKAKSWRQFQVFMECYNSTIDIIGLAYTIDNSEIYPMAVITMLKILNANVCYGEYCEAEFYGKEEWESIDLDEDEEGNEVVKDSDITNDEELEEQADNEMDEEDYFEGGSKVFYIRPAES